MPDGSQSPDIRPGHGGRDHAPISRPPEGASDKQQESLFSPLNREKSQRPLIPYAKAKIAIEVISAIQDERKIEINLTELEQIKALNEQYGGHEDAIRLTGTNETVVYTQEVLRNSNVSTPQTADFDHKDGSPAHSEIADEDLHINVARSQLAKVQNRDEETIDTRKV